MRRLVHFIILDAWMPAILNAVLPPGIPFPTGIPTHGATLEDDIRGRSGHLHWGSNPPGALPGLISYN